MPKIRLIGAEVKQLNRHEHTDIQTDTQTDTHTDTQIAILYILVAWQGHRGDQKSHQTKQNSSQSNIIKDGQPGHLYI